MGLAKSQGWQSDRGLLNGGESRNEWAGFDDGKATGLPVGMVVGLLHNPNPVNPPSFRAYLMRDKGSWQRNIERRYKANGEMSIIDEYKN